MKPDIILPKPLYDGNSSVEYALKARRSVRCFSNEIISLQLLSQILWAGNGISQGAYRTAGKPA